MEPTTSTSSAFSTVIGYFVALLTGYAFLRGVDYIFRYFTEDKDSIKAQQELEKRVLESLDPNNKAGSIATILDSMEANKKATAELTKKLGSKEFRKAIATDVVASVVSNFEHIADAEAFEDFINDALESSLATATKTIKAEVQAAKDELVNFVQTTFANMEPIEPVIIKPKRRKRPAKQPEDEEGEDETETEEVEVKATPKRRSNRGKSTKRRPKLVIADDDNTAEENAEAEETEEVAA